MQAWHRGGRGGVVSGSYSGGSNLCERGSQVNNRMHKMCTCKI